MARLSHETDRQVVNKARAAYELNWSMEQPDGEKVWLKVNRVPLWDHDGKVVGVLSTAEDITQNVRLQNQLLESTKIEAIGTLAGGIAHDFNNILTSIINSTELAMEDLPQGSMTASDLARTLKAARRGSRLVKQILTFTRADLQDFKPTLLADVVQEAVALIEASLPGNIEIETDISGDSAFCLADPTQIHQIVMNLCTNAFQALRGAGGRLAVRLTQCNVDPQTAASLNLNPGMYSRLAISDNGPGIDSKIVDKIFDPFFTTKEPGEGTGLGLAVVHGIVKGHNGAVRVSSVPNTRTDFEIFLPTLAAMPLIPEREELTVCSGEETILFVEDDADQLKLIPRVLIQLGYKVLALKNGREACRALDGDLGPVDLVITDYDMPEMNGLQLAEFIEAYDPRIPVIMVTGRKAPDGVQNITSNIKKLLLKPYNKATISSAIREVLEAQQGFHHADNPDH